MDIQSNNRTNKRREKVHNEILTVASRLICEKGSSSVSLEEIARYADVARKTVYNHFDNKEALINELVLPVCNHAREYLRHIELLENITLDHIWDYCLELWELKDLNAVVLYQITAADYSQIKESKHGFIIVFMKLLEGIPELKDKSESVIRNTAEVIYATYIPLLQIITSEVGYQIKFKKGMTGLIKGVLN